MNKISFYLYFDKFHYGTYELYLLNLSYPFKYLFYKSSPGGMFLLILNIKPHKGTHTHNK